ncbi:hypothetical protein NPS01_16650 [Nocardioides psychrotolerans]|uniref:DUF4307 domain-containing protein n=1 Tax=Nocardioides psychrotolerans TaxID=1005945 RepID=A0A1I3IHA6_9ACTN|nr:DUF4307 domain-containing protein [Nocardioides psychrotolerans]GEP38002.1 hypothetical protein NPS01_16650 [Nocardioides psychrotolerans]SFI47311.1 protein of unknown function [Nocardioides psychrotolerans]
MSPQTPPPALVDRYGTPAPWRRRVVLIAAVTVSALFLSWLAWVTWLQATPPVDSELISFDVIDDHTATAVVQVELADDSVEATCLLRAFAEDHTVVGELSFVPDAAAGNRVEQTVRTERLATSVESIGCTAEGQSRPR